MGLGSGLEAAPPTITPCQAGLYTRYTPAAPAPRLLAWSPCRQAAARAPTPRRRAYLSPPYLPLPVPNPMPTPTPNPSPSPTQP
eukprot:scaffold98836_cov42-Phaeocystis_antarctica.AAC.3